MILITAAAFLLFWIRDYWLLQLGPARKVALRVWIYVGLISVAALSLWVLASTHNTAHFMSDSESPPWLIGLFAFHSIAAVACFWIRSTERYDLAWLAAIVPAPVAWVLFARAFFSSNENMAELTRGVIVIATSLLLICPVLWAAVLRGRRFEMELDEMEYAVGFAGLTNCFGAGLVVLAVSPAAAESFDNAIRALSVH